MKYKIKVKHLFWLIPISFFIISFTTGWEHGFFGTDSRGISGKILVWQGVARVTFLTIAGYAIIIWGISMMMDGPPRIISNILNKNLFTFNTNILKRKTTNDDWEEFLEWKKKHALNKHNDI